MVFKLTKAPHEYKYLEIRSEIPACGFIMEGSMRDRGQMENGEMLYIGLFPKLIALCMVQHHSPAGKR